MKLKAKNVAKPAVTAAGVLLTANVILDLTTGHREGVMALARVATYVALGLLSAPLWMWIIGRRIPLIHSTYKALAGAVRKGLTAPAVQVLLGGWLALGWTGILASNTWSLVRPGARWLAPLDVFTGDAFAFGGGVLGAVALLGAVATATVLARRRAKNRPDRNDPHATSLEELLAPSMKEIKHLLVEKGSLAEVTRPYLGDCMVKKTWFGGMVTTRPVLPLYLSAAASGWGLIAVPGTGKLTNALCNTALRPCGVRTPYDDGFGLGFIGPEIFVSNTAEIATTIKARLMIATAALRMDLGGGEPSHEQIRELVSIFDPTGACHNHPELNPYRKGWNPLSDVTDGASAKKLAQGLLASELASSTTNSEFFAKAGVRLVSAFLLGAARGGHPFSRVCTWADEIQHAERASNVAGTLARLLDGPDSSPDDKRIYEKFDATYVRLRDGGDGERSAVWGTLEGSLDPFTSVAIAAATDRRYNLDMMNLTKAVSTPYATTYVIMPSDPLELPSVRPVFTAFMDALIATALKVATSNPLKPTLKVPLLITYDELETTRVFPKLAESLATFRGRGIRVQWMTQTFDGLSAAYSEAQMRAIIKNSGALLTYARGTADDHLKSILDEIGAMTVTKVSRSKRHGEDAGESSSKERVQPVDLARLMSELPNDMMFLQLSGSSKGMAAGKGQLKPLIVRQHRAAASPDELAAGWWVDPVMRARFEDGSAVGVAAQDRPHDRGWVQRSLRVYRFLAAHVRQPAKV